MKLVDIVNARQIIVALSNNATNVRLAYQFVKFLEKTQADYDFYANRYKEIVDSCGGIVKDDGIEFEGNKSKEFTAAVNELQQTDAEDPGIRFSLEDLANDLKLSVQQIYMLFPFIKE